MFLNICTVCGWRYGEKKMYYIRITSLSLRLIFPLSQSLWNIPDEENKDG